MRVGGRHKGLGLWHWRFPYRNRARSQRAAAPPGVKIGSPAEPPTTVFRENASAAYILLPYAYRRRPPITARYRLLCRCTECLYITMSMRVTISLRLLQLP